MNRRSDDDLSTSARRSIAVLIVGLSAIAAALLGATPAGATNPSISVSPSTGLHAGQTVTVTGSGFTKNAQVYIVECVAGASSENQCSFDFSDLSTVVVAKSDGAGNVRAASPVLKTSFKTTDCTKTACEIAAHQTISFTLSAANTATHSISFGAASHPSSTHAAPTGTTRSSTAATGPTTAGASTSGAASTAASTGTSSTSSSSAAGSGATTTASGTSTGSDGLGVLSANPTDGSSPSTTARTIKVKAKNGGRYAVVAIVAVLAVLFVGAMAASGRRRRPGA